MANIQPNDLAAAIQSELTIYAKDVKERVDEAGLTSIKELVRRTKATAPIGKSHKHFRDNIAYKVEKNTTSGGMSRYIWYVKALHYRLTHLLVNGHQTRNGGRTRADPFLRNALDAILPQYESAVKEAIKK